MGFNSAFKGLKINISKPCENTLGIETRTH